MNKFIEDLGVIPTIQDPVEIFYDNKGAIVLAKETRSYKITRHIHWRFSYIQNIVEQGVVCICKVHTNQNIVVPFTKSVPLTKLEYHARTMRIRYLSE